MDATSGSVASLASSSDRQVFGAQVVAKTLDYMNQNHGSNNGQNAGYDFQKSVLGAWASGAIVNNWT